MINSKNYGAFGIVIEEYSDDQERDDQGRWTAGESASTNLQHDAAAKMHMKIADRATTKGNYAAAEAHINASSAHHDAAHGVGKDAHDLRSSSQKSLTAKANKMSTAANKFKVK